MKSDSKFPPLLDFLMDRVGEVEQVQLALILLVEHLGNEKEYAGEVAIMNMAISHLEKINKDLNKAQLEYA